MNIGVPDLQEELIDLLDADSSLDGVFVSFSPPPEVPKDYERIYGFNEANYTLGGGEQAREESFALRLVVEVYGPGNDSRATSRRRWEIVDAIDTVLMDEDFHGYQTMGMTLQAESEIVAYDDGFLARSVLSIGATQEV